jgi:hypothetical protein
MTQTAQFEVTSSYGNEFFHVEAEAKHFAERQSELLCGKFFVYDNDWSRETPLALFRDGGMVS